MAVYRWHTSSLCCVTPSSDVTISSSIKVGLGQAHGSHAIVVLDWCLQFHQRHIIVVVFVRVILGMFDNFVDCHILFISIQVMKVVLTWYGIQRKRQKTEFKSNELEWFSVQCQE